MALTKFRHLYEVLLRFGRDGQIVGAHAQYLEGISEDGVAIQAQEGPAIPLSLVDVADKPTLKGVLGEATEALLLAKEEAERQARDLTAENQAKDANIQDLINKVDDLKAADARAASTIEENVTLRHEVLTLRAQVLGTEPPAPLEEWRKQFEEPAPEEPAPEA